MATRVERDPLGELHVPAEAYYGVQTQRAVENFPISGLKAPAPLVTATVLDQAGLRARERRARAARPGDRRRHQPGRGRDPRGPAARSIRRRRLSGRGRHVAQHERQRGARQPRRRDPRRAEGHLPARPPQRSREHGTVDQRRVPDGDAPLHPARAAGSAGVGGGARRGARRQGGRVRARAEDRTHAPSGRRPDHARTGIQRVCRERPPRGRRAGARRGGAARAQSRRDGGRHRPQRRRRLHAGEHRQPRRAPPASR